MSFKKARSPDPVAEADAILRIGEEVDRLITVDVNTRQGISTLYAAAREVIKKPLTLAAAELIRKNARRGGHAIIATGERMWAECFRTHFYSQTDGPAGSAALARALYLAYNARPVVVTDPRIEYSIEAACRGAGLVPVTLEELDLADDSRYNYPAVAVISLPSGVAESTARAKELLDALDPFAVIAVEKEGLRVSGAPFPKERARVDPLFNMAREKGIRTIGVADGGNEIGCGLIPDVVERLFPGKACLTPTDVLVIAAVSNWGASGICALLSALEHEPDILLTGADEIRILQESVRNGTFDGPTGAMVPNVDNIPGFVSSYLTEIMRVIVDRGFTTGDLMFNPTNPKYRKKMLPPS